MIWIVTDNSQIELQADETPLFADSFDGYDLSLQATKSRHPVSKNANKSDHISLEPRRLRLEGCIGSQGFNKGVDIFAGVADRTAAACDLINKMWRSKECATVIVKGKSFPNMALISAPIRCSNDGRLSFSLEFEEFEFYDISETFDATIGRKVDLGEVATTTGQPQEPPANFSTNTTPRLDYFIANPSAFDCSECGTANNIFCLDACYENAYLEAGL